MARLKIYQKRKAKNKFRNTQRLRPATYKQATAQREPKKQPAAYYLVFSGLLSRSAGPGGNAQQLVRPWGAPILLVHFTSTTFPAVYRLADVSLDLPAQRVSRGSFTTCSVALPGGRGGWRGGFPPPASLPKRRSEEAPFYL